MKKLYEKSEIWFAVAWIIAYCVLKSLGDNLSASVGIGDSCTVPILLVLSVVLYLFVKKNGLSEKYGLCKSVVPASRMLFYIPVLIFLTGNLWYGVTLRRFICWYFPATAAYILMNWLRKSSRVFMCAESVEKNLQTMK